MLGTKFYKNGYNGQAYAAAANWCNANQAVIADQGAYYEVTVIPPFTEEEMAEVNALEAEAAKEELRRAWLDSQIATSDTAIGAAFRAAEGLTLPEALTRHAAGTTGEPETGGISGAVKE